MGIRNGFREPVAHLEPPLEPLAHRLQPVLKPKALAADRSEDHRHDHDHEALEPIVGIEERLESHDGNRDRRETDPLHHRLAHAFREPVADEDSRDAAESHGREVDEGPETSHEVLLNAPFSIAAS
jgi:hypothetical protein